MTTDQFFQQLESRIAKYDLLCHPFYKAWSAGQLTVKTSAPTRRTLPSRGGFPNVLGRVGCPP